MWVYHSKPTFRLLCSCNKRIIHQSGTNLDSVAAIEKFLMERPNNSLSDPKIESRTSCSAVTLLSIRPTRLSKKVICNNPGNKLTVPHFNQVPSVVFV